MADNRRRNRSCCRSKAGISPVGMVKLPFAATQRTWVRNAHRLLQTPPIRPQAAYWGGQPVPTSRPLLDGQRFYSQEAELHRSSTFEVTLHGRHLESTRSVSTSFQDVVSLNHAAPGTSNCQAILDSSPRRRAGGCKCSRPCLERTKGKWVGGLEPPIRAVDSLPLSG